VSWQGLKFDFTSVIFDVGSFGGAEFSGGTVSFSRAEFSGGIVGFGGVKFADARVDFRGAGDWSNPPRFSTPILSTLKLPAAHHSNYTTATNSCENFLYSFKAARRAARVANTARMPPLSLALPLPGANAGRLARKYEARGPR
jgi:hypothetical protein